MTEISKTGNPEGSDSRVGQTGGDASELTSHAFLAEISKPVPENNPIRPGSKPSSPDADFSQPKLEIVGPPAPGNGTGRKQSVEEKAPDSGVPELGARKPESGSRSPEPVAGNPETGADKKPAKTGELPAAAEDKEKKPDESPTRKPSPTELKKGDNADSTDSLAQKNPEQSELATGVSPTGPLQVMLNGSIDDTKGKKASARVDNSNNNNGTDDKHEQGLDPDPLTPRPLNTLLPRNNQSGSPIDTSTPAHKDDKTKRIDLSDGTKDEAPVAGLIPTVKPTNFSDLLPQQSPPQETGSAPGRSSGVPHNQEKTNPVLASLSSIQNADLNISRQGTTNSNETGGSPIGNIIGGAGHLIANYSDPIVIKDGKAHNSDPIVLQGELPRVLPLNNSTPPADPIKNDSVLPTSFGPTVLQNLFQNSNFPPENKERLPQVFNEHQPQMPKEPLIQLLGDRPSILNERLPQILNDRIPSQLNDRLPVVQLDPKQTDRDHDVRLLSLLDYRNEALNPKPVNVNAPAPNNEAPSSERPRVISAVPGPEMQLGNPAPRAVVEPPEQKRQEQSIQNLVNLLSELKQTRNDNANDSSHRDLATPSIPQIAKQEIAMLPTFMRALEFNFSRVSNEQGKGLDPNNPTLTMARQAILAEAGSLKDLISSARGLDALRPSEPVSLSALKGDPSHVGLKGLSGLILDPQGNPITGKIDPLTGKFVGLDGKFDPTMIGLKAGEILDEKGNIILQTKELLPTDKSLTGDRKDKIDKNDDGDESTDKVLDALLVRKTKDSKPENKDDKSGKAENKEPEVRRKYIVREGDTLESIAEKIIGDSRFSVLLEMINRGYIRYTWQGSVRKALLRVGQVIWLPTVNEVKVHRSLFFSKKESNQKSPASIMDAKSDDSSEAISDSEEIYGTLPILEVSDLTDSGNGAPETLPSLLQGIRRSGDRRNITLSFLPPPLIEGKNNASKKYSPTWSEIQVLIKRMKEASAQTNESSDAGRQTVVGVERPRYSVKATVETLDHKNRITSGDDVDGAFCTRLEKLVANEWKTVAYYESSGGRTARYIYKANGARRAIYLNLPEAKIREMSQQDFRKNWSKYTQDYDCKQMIKEQAVEQDQTRDLAKVS